LLVHRNIFEFREAIFKSYARVLTVILKKFPISNPGISPICFKITGGKMSNAIAYQKNSLKSPFNFRQEGSDGDKKDANLYHNLHHC
jgi:hypothetical protein